jgi:hypothetical protein
VAIPNQEKQYEEFFLAFFIKNSKFIGKDSWAP